MRWGSVVLPGRGSLYLQRSAVARLLGGGKVRLPGFPQDFVEAPRALHDFCHPMIPVIHVAADLGQGGTERSIELLATAAEGPRGQRVIALDRDGPTGERLRAAGVPVEIFAGDYAAAAAAIAAHDPAVALLNRSGRPEAKWTELIGRLATRSVMPLEVSHFGWLDRGAIAAGLKGSFAVSGTTLAKYLRQMFGHWPRAEEMAGVPLA